MSKRPSRAPTSDGSKKSSAKPAEASSARAPAQLKKSPPLAYIPCRTPGCEWEAGHEAQHPCGKKLSGSNRPMTDAEVALLKACMGGSGLEFTAAHGAVLLERLDPALEEDFVQALVRERLAMRARTEAWNRVVQNLTGSEKADGDHNFGKHISPVYDKLYREADRRIEEGDEQTRKMDVARTPPHAQEFRETQRAVAGADVRHTAHENVEKAGKAVASLFTDEEVEAQDALERSKRPPRHHDDNAAQSTQPASVY